LMLPSSSWVRMLVVEVEDLLLRFVMLLQFSGWITLQ
jgi:hypothetical protein